MTGIGKALRESCGQVLVRHRGADIVRTMVKGGERVENWGDYFGIAKISQGTVNRGHDIGRFTATKGRYTPIWCYGVTLIFCSLVLRVSR